MKILGTPVGSSKFMARVVAERLAEEQKMICSALGKCWYSAQDPAPPLADVPIHPNTRVHRRSRHGHDASRGEVVRRFHQRGHPPGLGAPVPIIACAVGRTWRESLTECPKQGSGLPGLTLSM